MQKIAIVMISIVGLLVWAQANSSGGVRVHKAKTMPKNYRMVPFAKAQILQKGPNRAYCVKCGMTLPMFYRTNHAAKVDGKMEQFCSMYCLVEELNSAKSVSDIQVVDNTTLKFIPVSKAFYVVGSSKPATMAKKSSKYAFGTREAAEEFASKFGGSVMSYEEALAIARRDFDNDTKAKNLRQAKAAQKGEMIYKKLCAPIKQKFDNVSDAKSYVKTHNLCGSIRGKALQAVGLYLVR